MPIDVGPSLLGSFCSVFNDVLFSLLAQIVFSVCHAQSVVLTEEIINTPKHIAESFNSHFAIVGEKLASDITPSVVEPGLYVVPAETHFNESPSYQSSLLKTESYY